MGRARTQAPLTDHSCTGPELPDSTENYRPVYGKGDVGLSPRPKLKCIGRLAALMGMLMAASILVIAALAPALAQEHGSHAG